MPLLELPEPKEQSSAQVALLEEFADLEKLGSYKAVQEKNLVTLEGKEYMMKDGDVAYFRFSV